MRNLLITLILTFSSVVQAQVQPAVKNFGWMSLPKEVERVDNATQNYKHQLQQLVKYNDDSDALNYRFLFKALNDAGQLSSEEKSSGRLNSLNQGQVGSCFMYDALITMADGSQKQICDVKVGDYVVTHAGNIKKVIQVFIRPYKGRMATLKLWGHYGSISTEDHLTYTMRGWVPTNELQSEDMVGLIRRPIGGNIYINTRNFVDSKFLDGQEIVTSTRTMFKQLPERLEKTYDLGWLFGSYLAEGNSDGNKVVWTWSIDEKNTHVKNILRILDNLDIQSSISEQETKSTIKVVINSVGYSQLFKELCGTGSYTKTPHGELLSGPRPFLNGIYRGWLDGDGHARRNGEHGKTISKNLAIAMLSLDIALGNNSIISTQPGVATAGVNHRYDSYQVGHQDQNTDNWRVISEPHMMWRKVRDIEYSDYDGLVYNLEVEDDHSFIADGIARHNCVGYSTTQALDILASTNIYMRTDQPESWNVRFNPDAIYGIGRNDNTGGWDGSTGAWSVEGLRKYGTLHRLVYGSYDLTNTKPQDGRAWARSGMPAELLEKAAEHKVNACAKLSSVQEAKAALQNGYPIIVCAAASYNSTRDSDGFSKLTGRAWNHAMAVIAYRGNASRKEGYLIWNSWGNNWNSGGIYPEDQPHGSFWVTPSDLKFHIDQGDSWAIAGYEGFKFRKISWAEVFDVGRLIK